MQNPLEFFVVLAMVGVYSSPVYLATCVPGFFACWLIRRLCYEPYRLRAALLAGAILLLVTPVLVPSHSPLVLAPLFALALANHLGGPWAMVVSLYSLVPTAVLLLLFARRYDKRRLNGQKVGGVWERFWRGEAR